MSYYGDETNYWDQKSSSNQIVDNYLKVLQGLGSGLGLDGSLPQSQQSVKAPMQNKPICLHPSGEITEIRVISSTGTETCSEVKCEACHKIFNAEKTVERIKLRHKLSPDDNVDVKYIDKVYWTEIDPKKCTHASISVSKKSITNTASLSKPGSWYNHPIPTAHPESWHYATATCKKCLRKDLSVKQRYELIYRKGAVVKEIRTGWIFH